MKWVLLLFAALVAGLGADPASAGSASHQIDSEIALVRDHMRSGEYRYAVAYAAHIAAEHPDDSRSAALYAGLLRLGGQEAIARRLFDGAANGVAVEAIVAVPRSPLPEGARPAGNGVLVDSGRRALLPSEAIGEGERLWVRNALGEISRARIERRKSGVAVARLDVGLPFDEELELSTRAPFPGSVAFAVGYPAASGARASWPLLASGFVGRAGRVPHAGSGGAVFDAGGRLLGIAIAGDAGAYLVHIAQFPEAVRPMGPVSLVPRAAMPIDRIYEGALRTSVQVLVAP